MKKYLLLLLIFIACQANATGLNSNFISVVPTCPQTFPSFGTPVISTLKSSSYYQVTGLTFNINPNLSENYFVFVNSKSEQQAMTTASQIVASGLTPYSNNPDLYSVEGKMTFYYCTYQSPTYNLPDIPFQQAYSSGSQVAYVFIGVYSR